MAELSFTPNIVTKKTINRSTILNMKTVTTTFVVRGITISRTEYLFILNPFLYTKKVSDYEINHNLTLYLNYFVVLIEASLEVGRGFVFLLSLTFAGF